MNPSRSEGAAQLAGCNPKPEPEPVTNWTYQDSLNKTTLTHSAPQTQARAHARVRASHGFASRSSSCSSCSSVLFFFFSFFLSLYSLLPLYPLISIRLYYLLLCMQYAFFFIHCFQCSEGGLHIRFWVCTFVRCILYYIPCNSGRCVMSSL